MVKLQAFVDGATKQHWAMILPSLALGELKWWLRTKTIEGRFRLVIGKGEMTTDRHWPKQVIGCPLTGDHPSCTGIGKRTCAVKYLPTYL